MIESTVFLDQPNCCRIANSDVDLVLSTEIGPRILRYGFVDDDNVLGIYPHLSTPTCWGDWKPWGGHRLWVGPEEMPRSYAPDNIPVRFEATGHNSVCLRQSIDAAGFEKQLAVQLSDESSSVMIEHQITNRTHLAMPIAPWAITIMRSGGVALIPQEPFRSHDEYLLPARSIVVWYFTDLTDPRLRLGRKLLRLYSDGNEPEPQKIGAANQQGWCAHYHEPTQTLFVKRVSYDPVVQYPDFGANVETYTAGNYIELETLGPLQNLGPGESATHVERWLLFRGVNLSRDDDVDAITIKSLLE